MDNPQSTRTRGDKIVGVLLYTLLAAIILAIAIPSLIVATRSESRSERIRRTAQHQLQATRYNPEKLEAVFTRLKRSHPVLANELMTTNSRWEDELIAHDIRLEVEVADDGINIKHKAKPKTAKRPIS